MFNLFRKSGKLFTSNREALEAGKDMTRNKSVNENPTLFLKSPEVDGFVASVKQAMKKASNRVTYRPHQGTKEMKRRRRQLAKGMLGVN